MDQSVSLRYMRTVQQLEKKTEEVDQLLRGAKDLDNENKSLKHKNDELVKKLEALSLSERRRDEEVAVLESHVRKQQQKLQIYIDKEAMAQRGALVMVSSQPKPSEQSNAQIPRTERSESSSSKELARRQSPKSASSRRDQPKELEQKASSTTVDAKVLLESQQKLLESETARVALQKDYDLSLTEGHRLRHELEEARRAVENLTHQLTVRDEAIRDAVRREDGMKATLRHLNQRHVAAALESQEIEAIEAKALDGLKAELLLLESENDRLKLALQEERHRYRDAKSEFEKSSQLLTRQKALFDAHQKISAEEIVSLTNQLESVLGDMKSQAERLSLQNSEVIRLQSILNQKEQNMIAAPTIKSPAGPASTSGRSAFGSGAQDARLTNQQQQQHSVRDRGLEDPETLSSTHPPQLLKGAADDGAGELAKTVRELLARIDVLHKERDDAVASQLESSQAAATQRRQIEALEGEVDSLRLQLESLRAFTAEKEAVDRLRKEKDAIQAEEIRRLSGALATTEAELSEAMITKVKLDPAHELVVRKIDMEILRNAASKCLVASTGTYRLMESIAQRTGAVSENIGGDHPPEAPSAVGDAVRAIYNDVVGSHIALLHAAAVGKGIVRQRTGAHTNQPLPSSSATRLVASRQSAEGPPPSRTTVFADTQIAPTPSSKQRFPRGADKYTEGLSLKDVVEDYRRTSPRRAAHLDPTITPSLRNPLQMASWELRRLQLLDGA